MSLNRKAPIQEVPESPTPTPEVAPTPQPKKSAPKPKSKPSAEPFVKPQTKPNAPPLQTGAARFAGTWSGIVNYPHPTVGGNQECTVLMNPADDSATATLKKGGVLPGKINISGNTLSWHSGMLGELTFTLTTDDGQTVRMTVVSGLFGSGAGILKKIN